MSGSADENGLHAPPRVVALAADLMFGARIRGAAQVAGVDVKLARNADTLVAAARAGAALALLDLDARGVDIPAVITALHAAGARVICFAPHVRNDLIDAARSAGADRVMARSAFVRELPSLLATGGHAPPG